MTRRKSVMGISALVALAFCAIAASSAFAGGRAFECASGSGVGFSDAHCVTAVGSGASFKHVEIANGVATAITGTNAKTASSTTAASVAKLKGKLSGIATEVDCTTVTGSGSLTNSAAPSVSGTGKIEYSGCTVVAPVRECKVGNSGKITTKELSATTAGLGANQLKFAPASGTEFTTIPIEGCKENLPPAANYLVTGSLIGTTSGATTTTTHTGVTGQGTLFFGGNVAGLEGSITISKTSNSNPITLT